MRRDSQKGSSFFWGDPLLIWPHQRRLGDGKGEAANRKKRCFPRDLQMCGRQECCCPRAWPTVARPVSPSVCLTSLTYSLASQGWPPPGICVVSQVELWTAFLPAASQAGSASRELRRLWRRAAVCPCAYVPAWAPGQRFPLADAFSSKKRLFCGGRAGAGQRLPEARPKLPEPSLRAAVCLSLCVPFSLGQG